MTTATAAASLPSRRTTPTGISKKCFRAKVLKRHRELSEERDVRLCHCVCERERKKERKKETEKRREWNDKATTEILLRRRRILKFSVPTFLPIFYLPIVLATHRYAKPALERYFVSQ